MLDGVIFNLTGVLDRARVVVYVCWHLAAWAGGIGGFVLWLSVLFCWCGLGWEVGLGCVGSYLFAFLAVLSLSQFSLRPGFVPRLSRVARFRRVSVLWHTFAWEFPICDGGGVLRRSVAFCFYFSPFERFFVYLFTPLSDVYLSVASVCFYLCFISRAMVFRGQKDPLLATSSRGKVRPDGGSGSRSPLISSFDFSRLATALNSSRVWLWKYSQSGKTLWRFSW